MNRKIARLSLTLSALMFGQSFAAPAMTINGVWEHESTNGNFTLTIAATKGKVIGNYCAIMRGGSRIDCPPSNPEKNVTGTYSGNQAKLTFQSFLNPAAHGKAVLTIISTHEAQWNLTDHQGDIFIPVNTTLVRNDESEVINTERATIYATPSSAHPTHAYFIQGDIVTPLEKLPNGWIKIEYGNEKKQGWLPQGSYK